MTFDPYEPYGPVVENADIVCLVEAWEADGITSGHAHEAPDDFGVVADLRY